MKVVSMQLSFEEIVVTPLDLRQGLTYHVANDLSPLPL